MRAKITLVAVVALSAILGAGCGSTATRSLASQKRQAQQEYCHKQGTCIAEEVRAEEAVAAAKVAATGAKLAVKAKAAEYKLFHSPAAEAERAKEGAEAKRVEAKEAAAKAKEEATVDAKIAESEKCGHGDIAACGVGITNH